MITIDLKYQYLVFPQPIFWYNNLYFIDIFYFGYRLDIVYNIISMIRNFLCLNDICTYIKKFELQMLIKKKLILNVFKSQL